MPVYTITAPNGEVFDVTAPEGATQEQVLAYAQANYKQANAQSSQQNFNKTAEELSGTEQFFAGMGGAVKGLSLGARQIIPGLTAPTEAELTEYKQAMEGLRGTGAGMAGEITGSVATSAIPMGAAARIPQVARALSQGGVKAGATIAGLGATEGTAMGALAPVQEGESRASNMVLGGTISAVAPAVVGAVGRAGQKSLQLVKEYGSTEARKIRAGNILRETAGDKAADIEASLRAAPAGVNAAQAAVGQASPTFSALQEVIDRYAPEAGSTLADTQAANRLASLRAIGRDSPTADAPKTNLDLAVKAREKKAGDLYGKAYAADDARVMALQKKAETQAQRASGGIAQGAQTPAQIPLHSAVEPLLNDEAIVSAASDVARRTGQFGDNPMVSLRGLNSMLDTINNDLANIAARKPTTLNNVTERQLIEAKGKLVGAMEQMNPAYKQARSTYQAMSTPINQMKIGQDLELALRSALEGGAERGTVFAKRIQDAAKIIQKKTGQQRYESLSELFTPEQMKRVNDVVQALETDVRVSKLAERGKSKVLNMLGASETVLPNTLKTSVTIANNVFSRLMKSNQERTLTEMAQYMQDPKMVAYLMAKSDAKEKAAIRNLVNWQRNTAVGASAATQMGQR